MKCSRAMCGRIQMLFYAWTTVSKRVKMNYLSSQRQLSGHHHEIIGLIKNNDCEEDE
jgi:hypothetical protein